MSRTNQNHEGQPFFELYPYDASAVGKKVNGLINDGVLPRELWFKLAALGHNEADPESGRRLSWVIVNDLADNAQAPENMKPVTKTILEDDLPNGIIDWQHGGHNTEAYTSFEDMYYRVHDLATSIFEFGLVSEGSEDERRTYSRAAAKGLWRTLVKRHHPEWLQNPSLYYASRISYESVYDAKEPTMRKRIIARAVLSDPLIYSTYEEAVNVGVVGIGPKGKESLRILLSEEHPELM